MRARSGPWLIISTCLLCLGLASCASTPPIRNGIARLETVRIGGVDQWISIRGQDARAPVLLFLHGGPGSPEIPLTRYYLDDLEKYFVIVNWDQRGAGKSYAAGRARPLSIDLLVEDTRELSEHLLREFHQKKIYVLGHSWGTLLGVLTVTRYPQLFAGYGGVGQYVQGQANETLAFEYALRMARETGNAEALAELGAMSGYPHAFDPEGKWFTELQTERKWLTLFGAVCLEPDVYRQIAGVYLGGPEYTVVDMVNYLRGELDANRALWPAIFSHDLSVEAPRFQVPVYFFLGRHDYVTPSILAASYFSQLRAPKKGLYWFERSAHCAMYEEPEAFQRAVVESFLSPSPRSP